MKLAIFDFDGTLYSLDTFTFVVNQLKKSSEHKAKYARFVVIFFPNYLLYKLGLINKAKMTKVASQTLVNLYGGLTREQLYSFYRQTFLRMADKKNHQVVKEVVRAKEEGYEVIIVSGAVTPLLEIAGEELGFDKVFGTDIFIKNGIVESSESLDHIYGKRKLTRLLEEYPKEEVDWANSRAYADSFSDLDLLEQVGYPVVVQPDAKLLAEANARGWRII